MLRLGEFHTGDWAYNHNLETWDLVWMPSNTLAGVVDAKTGAVWTALPRQPDAIMTSLPAVKNTTDGKRSVEAWLKSQGAEETVSR